MKLTVLIENTKGIKHQNNNNLKTQHGLSIYIETGNKKILLDVGANSLFKENSALLGVDLSRVDLGILSHSHGDHGGGLSTFFELNKIAPFYMHKACQNKYYSQRANPTPHYIGLDQEVISKYKERVSFIDDDILIEKNIYLLTNFINEFPRPISNNTLFLKQDGVLVKDTFEHEIALLIKEPDGNILFSSCSHSGIYNIVKTVTQKHPETLKAVIGGFHLSGSAGRITVTDSYIEQLSQALGEFNTEYYTCHCTGDKGISALTKDQDSRIHAIGTGDTLSL